MSKKLTAKMPDGRTVYGGAAQLHIIKDDGGWDEHHRKFAARVIDTVMKEYDKELAKRNLSILKGKKSG